MNYLASRAVVDDTCVAPEEKPSEGDVEVSPEALVRAELDLAEQALDQRRSGDAEDALNRAASIYRALDVPNTSRRYRILARRAAYARLGELPEDDKSGDVPAIDEFFTSSSHQRTDSRTRFKLKK